jgi:hypothetical protein
MASHTFGHPDLPGVEITVEGEDDDSEACVTVSGARPDQVDFVVAWLQARGLKSDAIRVTLK